ncbi:Light-sensor Protein kinase [Serendipita sp. 411]|nr:Light-sensor Protein kinase [Serendipita sp. 411]
MQSPDDRDEPSNRSSEHSSTSGDRSKSFVFPIRSLLGPVQPTSEIDILDALLTPPIQSAQTSLSVDKGASSYFTSNPGASKRSSGVVDPSRSSPLAESFPFRHFPGEKGSPSFTSNPLIDVLNDGYQNYNEDTGDYEVQEPPDKEEDSILEQVGVDVQALPSTPPNTRLPQDSTDDSDETQLAQRMPPSEIGSERQSVADHGYGSVVSGRPSSSLSGSENSLAAVGLVHLPPVTKLETQRRTREWRKRVSVTDSSTPSSHSHGQSSIPPRIEEEPEEGPHEKSGSFSVTTSSNQTGPLVTMRFEHTEDENGHHILTGREGNLTKCEDEPIRVPGAVQGFGVLLVLHDDNTSGQLKVRQVSENSRVILGLSPKYLFNLGCFTQTLPGPQADLFWDNIQFLPDLQLGDSDDDEGNSPQIFLLSGWGEPGTAIGDTSDPQDRRQWTCWVAAHRIAQTDQQAPVPSEGSKPPQRKLVIVEFELESDTLNPLYPLPRTPSLSQSEATSPPSGSGLAGSNSGGFTTESGTPGQSGGATTIGSTPSDLTPKPVEENTGSMIEVPKSDVLVSGDSEWVPSAEAILTSTTSRARPLKSLERLRRFNRATSIVSSQRPGVGTMDVFTLLQEINEQLGRALDLLQLLEIVVGVIKDLTQFHRVLCYQFDDAWNGQVVAELVDWGQTRDLYMGLHFPAADIPAQARQLYALNRVRLLYNRTQSTARLVLKDRSDLEPPLDMTHCYLRAMSPIHLKYLGNMHVRASMSISIVAFQKLWGIIACHSYGDQGMRVSFPVRQMLRLLSDSISRNVERLSYAQRLRTRKLISTVPTDQHPTGYIVSNSEDLLTLFDADYGVLVIGEGAKIIGPNDHGQDILLLAEYLRVKQFNLLQVSQSVMQDYPDLQLPSGLDVVAGLLFIPLSMTGKDFLALLRRGQAAEVNWAGRPPDKSGAVATTLEPRTSFKLWTERLVGRCRAWTDEQLDTAAVLALVYGKFIEVWRQKESAVQMNQMTTLLLSNTSHEVRTPLHQIINYLELALDGKKLDDETRDNLTRSHAASKALLFTINDLLDLTRLEAGKETSFNEPFDLTAALHEAVKVYQVEATRRQLEFQIDLGDAPRFVIGDSRKIKTVVANLTSNAVKYTRSGSISVTAHIFDEPEGLRPAGNVAVEIVVSDTGCGIQPEKLESIFREFEQVDSVNQPRQARAGLGLGLAVVARVVEQLGGQLRVDSKIDHGSRFSCLLPFPLASHYARIDKSGSTDEGTGSGASNTSEIDSLVEALSTSHMLASGTSSQSRGPPRRPKARKIQRPVGGKFDVEDSVYPVRGIKIDEVGLDSATSDHIRPLDRQKGTRRLQFKSPIDPSNTLRILIVEDDLINSRVLNKRLTTDGHDVVSVVNGQQAVDLVEHDRDFDCVLMDIQMPILDGFGATKSIRNIEKTKPIQSLPRRSTVLTGRIPVFAVSASLVPDQRPYMMELGMDGWILKPIEFKRLAVLLASINDISMREQNAYRPGTNWEYGGWLKAPDPTPVSMGGSADPSPKSEDTSGSGSNDPSPGGILH